VAETYSLNIDGWLAGATMASVTPNYTLPDSAARPGSMQNAMMLGKQILVQQPDGSQAWFTLDAERSTVTNPVLRRV
jgi:hypothetical protein